MSSPTDRIDPRCARSRQRVLAAAVEVLREAGLPGLTFEAVAARSGVAKSTIYRHFTDREALHIAAVESVGPQLQMRAGDDLAADLVEFLEGLDHALHHCEFGAVLLSGLDAAERSDRMNDLARAAAARRRSVVVQRLKVAQAAGDLHPDTDLDLLCALLVGPLFYRRFMSRQSTGPAFVARLVREVVTPLARPSPGSGAATGGGRPRR